MPETPADQVVTELKAVLSKWDLKFGSLVVVNLPPEVTSESDPILTRLNNWWITQSPFFRGAKIVVLKHGTSIQVENGKGLRNIGYVGLQDTVGEKTVLEVLQEYMANHGVTDEAMAIPLQRTPDPVEGQRGEATHAGAAAGNPGSA